MTQIPTPEMSEKETFLSFRDNYTVIVEAEPALPKHLWKKSVGWEFYGAILAAIGAILLAAFATAGEFHRISLASSGGQEDFFSYGRTISSLLGVEGLITIVAVIKVLTSPANTINRTHYDNTEKLALGVSAIAGFNAALRSVLLPDNFFVQAFTWLVIAILGIGGSYLAMMGGQILGYQTRYIREKMEQFESNYTVEYDNFKTRLQAAWLASPQYSVVTASARAAQLRAEAEVTSADELTRAQTDADRLLLATSAEGDRKVVRARALAEIENVRAFGGKNIRTLFPTRGIFHQEDVVRQKILVYLRQVCNADVVPGRGIAGPSQVARELKVAKSYAKTIIDEYILNEYPFKTREMIAVIPTQEIEQELA